MNYVEAMREIESSEFNARLNLASGISHFIGIAEDEEAVKVLNVESSKNRQVLIEVANRLSEIIRIGSDYRYENRWDIALAIYLWILNSASKAIGRSLAYDVIDVPRAWWATKIAREIVYSIDERTNSDDLYERVNLDYDLVEHIDESVGQFLSGMAKNVGAVGSWVLPTGLHNNSVGVSGSFSDESPKNFTDSLIYTFA